MKRQIQPQNKHTKQRKLNPFITAKIYSWTFNPSFDHPLKDCKYFGQTYQSLHTRTKQHKAKARCKPKELGLHALWKAFPIDDHWDIRKIEERRFDVDERGRKAAEVAAMEWMNEEEKRLIAVNGGILKSMDKKQRQTLNLTSGGQGNPRVVWEALEVRWSHHLERRVWPKFRAFYEENQHLRVPQKHHKLGNIVNNIRVHKCFLCHEDFKAWLDEHGFVYDERQAHVEQEVWPKFRAFYEENQHLRVPQRHPELGNIVSGIRNQKCFLWHEDFKAWLDEHGFVYDERQAHLEQEVWPKFNAFYEENQHLRVPRSHHDLGNIVKGIRNIKSFLWHEDFRKWLYEHGFEMYARNERKNRERWEEVLAMS